MDEAQTVRVEITSSPGISKPFFNNAKMGRDKYWWLYLPGKGYQRIPKVRGYLHLYLQGDFEIGQYILGVGPADYRGKRRTINIFADRAEVLQFYDTKATVFKRGEVLNVQREDTTELKDTL